MKLWFHNCHEPILDNYEQADEDWPIPLIHLSLKQIFRILIPFNSGKKDDEFITEKYLWMNY